MFGNVRSAMVHVGAAHEHAASEPAPNEDDAAQAPEPASASAGAGAGDVAYGRRSSQRRQMCDDTEFVTLGGLVVGPKPFGTKGL